MNLRNIIQLALILLLAIVSIVIFTAKGQDEESATVVDQNGNQYNTVVIGTQIWMTENLNVTTYNDGSSIPHLNDDAGWKATTSGAYCDYNNSGTYGNSGKLYNWYAVNSGKLAPKGWHVATYDDWLILHDYVTKICSLCSVAQALASNKYWKDNNTKGAIGYDVAINNKAGFNALPVGARFSNGSFISADLCGYWWTATQGASGKAFHTELEYNRTELLMDTNMNSTSGMSVRCVKD